MKSKINTILVVLALMLSWLLLPLAAHAAPTVTITSPTASSTVSSSFTVSGTAPANTAVTVKVNGATVGTPTSDGSGNWSLNVSGQTAGAKTITASSSESNLYAGLWASTNMLVFDTATNSPVAGSPFDVTPASVAFTTVNAAGTKAYTTSANGGPDLYEVNLNTNSYTQTLNVPTSILEQSVLSQDGSVLYVVDQQNVQVLVVDTSTMTVTSTIPLNGSMTNALAITMNSAGTKLYVGGSEVNVIDIGTATVTDVINNSVVGNVNYLSFNHAGTKLYSSLQISPGVIDVIDPTSNTVTASVNNVGNNVSEIAVSADDSKVYAPGLFDSPGNVYVIDAASNTVTTSIPVGLVTYGLEFAPNGTLYAVSLGNIFDAYQSGGIWAIDTSNNTATRVYTSEAQATAPTAIGRFIGTQTGSASVNVTVSSGSADTGTLAPTGADQRPVAILAFILMLVGLGALGYTVQLHKSR